MKQIIVGDFNTTTAIYGKTCYEGSIIRFNKEDQYYYVYFGIFGLDKSTYGNGVQIIVSSGTEEFDKLTEIVNETQNNELIEAYANEIAIKYADPKYICRMVEKIKNKKYQQGRNDVRSELLQTLGFKTA